MGGFAFLPITCFAQGLTTYAGQNLGAKRYDRVKKGVRQARVESLFYCMSALAHCIAGIMRGVGKPTVPMFTMLGFWCVLRVTYITAVLHFYPHSEVIFSACPPIWCSSCVVFVLYYFKADWMRGFDMKANKRSGIHSK